MTETRDQQESPLALPVALVRLQAEAALIRRMNAGYGFADARIPAEVYLRDDAARERMSRSSLRPQDSHIGQAKELAQALADVRSALAARPDPLAVLSDRFGLDDGERALLTIAIAYELDADARDLCHALAWRRRSALFADICQDIAPELADSRALLGALHEDGPLLRNCLLEMAPVPGQASGQWRGSTGSREVAVSRRVLDFLFGDTRIAGPLRTAMAIYPSDHRFHVYIADSVIAEVARVCGHLDGRLDGHWGDSSPGPTPVVLLQGALGSGKRAVAHFLARELGRPLAHIGLATVGNLIRREGDRALMRKALAETTMRGAVAYLPDIDALTRSADNPTVDDHTQLLLDAIDQHHDLMILATTERRMPSLPVRRPFHLIRLPTANLDVRQHAWRMGVSALADALGDATTPAAAESMADELAARYVIGPGTVGEVVADARAFARATRSPVKRADIEQAVGRRLAMRLGSFGTVISRRARMDEMVLPEDVIETLQDMIAMVRERTQILERWGYGRHLGLNRGVAALFSGEPGTGKTMAASVISSALGLELIRIDLSAVTSKWVGETEKHLAKIFDEAQTANAMLLFDEADSLFGKRTDLKSAQDRYANLEVNYVLQRMEDFDGISVLTTNFESAIDAAFLRRLNFRVRFPKPEIDERMELWRRLLPPDTGLAPESVDFDTLARRFVMTGGHIRNAIVRAAVVAARQGRPMTDDDLFTGALHEYAEMGKVMPSIVRS